MSKNIKLQKNIIEVMQAWDMEHGAGRNNQRMDDSSAPSTLLPAPGTIIDPVLLKLLTAPKARSL